MYVPVKQANPEKVFFNGNVEDWRPRASEK